MMQIKVREITVENYALPSDVGRYNILDNAEYVAQNKRHDLQIVQISNSLEVFKEYRKAFGEAIKQRREAEEWNNYLQCDGDPHTHIPSEIREFLYKIELLEHELAARTDSWLLNEDDKNITKNSRKLKIDYGREYGYLIGRLFGVLKLLENTLKTRYKVDSARVFNDLSMLKPELQCRLKDLLDRLSYKIISNTSSQMDKISTHTSEFVSSTDNFSMVIWTIDYEANVMDSIRYPKWNISVECMKTKIFLPHVVLQPNLALRAMHLKYDHYSESIESNEEIINPFVEDFVQYLKLQWRQKCDLQRQIKEKLVREKQEYEMYLVAKTEQDAKLKASKRKSSGKKVSKKVEKKKTPREPPIVHADQFPDVESDLKEQEDAAYSALIANWHPRKYSMDAYEVNLRQFIPLGGIYDINLIVKPAQISYAFLRIKSDTLPCILRTYVKECSHTEGSDIDSEPSESDEKSENISKYYIIKIQIAEKYVRWAEPLPCQFVPSCDVMMSEKDEIDLRSMQNETQSEYRKSIQSVRIDDRKVLTPRSPKKGLRKARKPPPSNKKPAAASLEDDYIPRIQEDSKTIGSIEDPTTRASTTPKWTTKHILKRKFDTEKGEMTIWTDRLGIFSLMYPRYIHFPYRKWSITSLDRSEVIFSLESLLAKFCFKITEEGITVLVTNCYTNISDSITYLEVLEPISSLDELKNKMIEQNLNIFPALDAGFYVEGRFSQKLFALEHHAYDCMAAYSAYIQFHRSEWNCIAGHRNIILKCDENRISQEYPLDLVQLTSAEARFVDIEEACTDIEDIVLLYSAAREIEYCADLLHLIKVSHPGSSFQRVKNPKFWHYVSELLKTIKPLSFS